MNGRGRRNGGRVLAAALVSTLLSSAATAHHSDSLYFVDDRFEAGGAIRIEGVISRVRWINPHVEFFVDVPGEGGPVVWAIETDSVNQLRELGWTERSIEAGDEVVVVVSKSKFDDTAGRLRDMLVRGAGSGEPSVIYLEYKSDGSEQWRAPFELYEQHSSCPGTAPFDPERQPGKETLLCATLSPAELEQAAARFGAGVLLLRGL